MKEGEKIEINEDALRKYLEILGGRSKYCVFGGRPEWDEASKRYLIPKNSPRKMTEWVDAEDLPEVLKGYIKRGWTVWISLNEKEDGEDGISGVKKINCVWFDFDPERDNKSVPATEEERKKALLEAEGFKKFMENLGLKSFMACSGNGYHLFFPVDYPLPGKEFRKEFNEKQRKFLQNLRAKSGFNFDTTTDIRRVTQPIGYPNMKIPDTPLPTYWVDEVSTKDIEEAREKNFQLIEAILNTKLKDEVEVKRSEPPKFTELLKKNTKLFDLYEGVWGKYGYKSRSEAEEALVTILCINGYTADEIKQIMQGSKIGKWQEAGESYRDLTIEKGMAFAKEHEHEKENKNEEVKKGEEKQENIGKEAVSEKDKVEIGPIIKDLMERYVFVTSEDNEDLYVYDDGIYRPGETLIKAEVEKIIDDKNSTYFSTEIINHIKRRTFVPRALFNADKERLPLKNGNLNLNTFELEPHTPEKIFTFKLNTEYDPNARSPKLEQFISEVVREDDIPLLQEFFGYVLYPDMPTHKTLWLYGTGRNGKSTIISILRMLLGNDCITSVPLSELDGDHRFSVARLYGKLANIIPEPETSKLMKTVMFKLLTGNDLISAEVKNKQRTIDFVNFAKFIIYGNNFPLVKDTTPAFWQRLIIIEFPNNFIDRAIPNLAEKLTQEESLSGFLNWCIAGLKRLKENNFQFSETKSSKQIKIDFERLSNSGQAFISEMCEIDGESLIPKSELYEKYKEYCAENDVSVMGKRELTNLISQLPRVKETTQQIKDKDTGCLRNTRCWRGIKLKPSLISLVYEAKKENARLDAIVQKIEQKGYSESEIMEAIDRVMDESEGRIALKPDENGYMYLEGD